MEKISFIGNKDKDILEREKKNGYITYSTLADYVGSMVLCNNIIDRYGDTLEVENGDLETYFNGEYEEITREEYEELEDNGEQCYSEPVDIYQYYIITSSGADFLERYTDEIVFYDNQLDIYVWGITHYGTSWDYVFTNIPVKK